MQVKLNEIGVQAIHDLQVEIILEAKIARLLKGLPLIKGTDSYKSNPLVNIANHLIMARYPQLRNREYLIFNAKCMANLNDLKELTIVVKYPSINVTNQGIALTTVHYKHGPAIDVAIPTQWLDEVPQYGSTTPKIDLILGSALDELANTDLERRRLTDEQLSRLGASSANLGSKGNKSAPGYSKKSS